MVTVKSLLKDLKNPDVNVRLDAALYLGDMTSLSDAGVLLCDRVSTLVE